MNYKITATSKPEIYRLSVNLKLPKLDLRCGFLDWDQPPFKTRTPFARQTAAKKLAMLNRGQTPFELPNPVVAYTNFLDAISLIEGLAEVVDVGPYSIDFVVGQLFEAEGVGQLLAELVQTLFYPQEPLVLVA